MNNDADKAVDRAVFRTEDPAKIKEIFRKSFDIWMHERSTLGGYLRDIRFLRDLSPSECALKSGVSRATWQSWESNRETPTNEELDRICQGMAFGEEKRKQLDELKGMAQHHRLFMLSQIRPEFLAARGVSQLEVTLEWQKLPAEIREALVSWGKTEGLESAEDILAFFPSLESDQEREEWVSTILRHLHELG